MSSCWVPVVSASIAARAVTTSDCWDTVATLLLRNEQTLAFSRCSFNLVGLREDKVLLQKLHLDLFCGLGTLVKYS